MDKPRLMSIYWASIGAAALALGACDIDQADEGNVPDPDVDVSLQDRQPAEPSIEGPEVDIDTQERQIEGPDVDVETDAGAAPPPDVDVDVPEEPDVDVNLPEEDDTSTLENEPIEDEAPPIN